MSNLPQGIETLARHAFDSHSETTSRNALRVLCNAMLLKPEARQAVVDLEYEAKACNRLRTENPDDEFLLSRLIFLTTYGTSINLPSLIEQHHMADSIIQNLSRHAARFSTGRPATSPMEGMALVETLKLLFNVTRFCNDHTGFFDPALPHITTILCALDLPTPQAQSPLDPPFSPLINALMNLDFSTPTAQAALYPASTPTSVADRLIQLLDISMKRYTDTNLDQLVTPLICVLSMLYDHAPTPTPSPPTTADANSSSVDVRRFVQERLLPTEEDRKTVLGRSDTLPSRLLRNWTNPLAPEFRKQIAGFYFAISGKDVVRFIENVGYGYASGFLFENKIPLPEGAAAGGSASAREDEAAGVRRAVNPITGQFLDEERYPDLPEMTDEEKEREAERLFVLFER
jgi:hypothetical protein